MAVTITANAGLSGENMRVFDIEATADGDTVSGEMSHGFGEVPVVVTIIPLVAAARISLWVVTTISSTVVELTKATTAGSGAAGNQVRVVISRPHSMVA